MICLNSSPKKKLRPRSRRDRRSAPSASGGRSGRKNSEKKPMPPWTGFLESSPRVRAVTQFKVEREQERLEQLTAQTQQKEQQAASLEKKIENIQKQQIAVQKVEQIEPHAVPFSSKVMLDRSEYENLATVAKKYVIQEKKERHLQKMLDAANKLISELTSKVTALTAELVEYKSVRGKLHTNELEHENRKLRDKLRSYEAVIDRHNLWHLFGRKRSKMVAREEIR